MKKRPGGVRKWILCFCLIFCLSKGIDSGIGAVSYLFYRKQYGVDEKIMSNLSTLFTILMFISQVINSIRTNPIEIQKMYPRIIYIGW